MRLTKKEADLLHDILVDALLYHHRLLEEYERLDSLESRSIFGKEKDYHSRAVEFVNDLVWEIPSLVKEQSK